MKYVKSDALELRWASVPCFNYAEKWASELWCDLFAVWMAQIGNDFSPTPRVKNTTLKYIITSSWILLKAHPVVPWYLCLMRRSRFRRCWIVVIFAYQFASLFSSRSRAPRSHCVVFRESYMALECKGQRRSVLVWLCALCLVSLHLLFQLGLGNHGNMTPRRSCVMNVNRTRWKMKVYSWRLFSRCHHLIWEGKEAASSPAAQLTALCQILSLRLLLLAFLSNHVCCWETQRMLMLLLWCVVHITSPPSWPDDVCL